MLIKPTVLALVVTALSVAAAWSLGNIDPDAECAEQADPPKIRLEPRRDVVSGQAAFSAGNWSDGSTQNSRIPYGMFDESRMH